MPSLSEPPPSHSSGMWSCFTFAVNLKNVCNPSTSTYVRNIGCCLRGTVTPTSGAMDLSGTASLFFSVQFNLTR